MEKVNPSALIVPLLFLFPLSTLFLWLLQPLGDLFIVDEAPTTLTSTSLLIGISVGLALAVCFLKAAPRKMFFLKVLLCVSWSLLYMGLFTLYFTALFLKLWPLDLALLYAMPLALASFIVLFLLNRRLGGFFSRFSVVLMASLTGPFLAIVLPILWFMLLASIAVIYDVLAAKRGFLGTLAEGVVKEGVVGLTYPTGKVHIGLGDLILASAIFSASLCLNWLLASTVAFMLLLGMYLNALLLRYWKVLPGTPLTIGLALVVMAIFFMLA
ncbi:MAG: hypothetical protein DRJ98_03950 [Thermoprotei archaeon]|nr:MAG: hypothetical protein DRJ98_03950 [Thermoprotei archaeon]